MAFDSGFNTFCWLYYVHAVGEAKVKLALTFSYPKDSQYQIKASVEL